MADQEQSGSGAPSSPPAAPAPPAPPLPPLPGLPDVDAITRDVQKKIAEKFGQKVDQARQKRDQAKAKYDQAIATYESKRNSENKGRVSDAKAEWKDATRDYEEAVAQATSVKWTGQNGVTIDLGGSRRRSSDSQHGVPGEVVPIVGMILLFLYLVVRAIMSPFNRKNRVPSSQPGNFVGGGFSQEEVALIQKMQRTLGQMETRVEALETILIEQQQSSARSRRMAGATVGATVRASAPSSATLRSNPNI